MVVERVHPDEGWGRAVLPVEHVQVTVRPAEVPWHPVAVPRSKLHFQSCRPSLQGRQCAPQDDLGHLEIGFGGGPDPGEEPAPIGGFPQDGRLHPVQFGNLPDGLEGWWTVHRSMRADVGRKRGSHAELEVSERALMEQSWHPDQPRPAARPSLERCRLSSYQLTGHGVPSDLHVPDGAARKGEHLKHRLPRGIRPSDPYGDGDVVAAQHLPQVLREGRRLPAVPDQDPVPEERGSRTAPHRQADPGSSRTRHTRSESVVATK
jgi:hypothetical protein